MSCEVSAEIRGATATDGLARSSSPASGTQGGVKRLRELVEAQLVRGVPIPQPNNRAAALRLADRINLADISHNRSIGPRTRTREAVMQRRRPRCPFARSATAPRSRERDNADLASAFVVREDWARREPPAPRDPGSTSSRCSSRERRGHGADCQRSVRAGDSLGTARFRRCPRVCRPTRFSAACPISRRGT